MSINFDKLIHEGYKKIEGEDNIEKALVSIQIVK